LVALVIPELDEVVGTGTEEHGFCWFVDDDAVVYLLVVGFDLDLLLDCEGGNEVGAVIGGVIVGIRK
jgi:hypothetical protein